jgi:hypothetical protein
MALRSTAQPSSSRLKAASLRVMLYACITRTGDPCAFGDDAAPSLA